MPALAPVLASTTQWSPRRTSGSARFDYDEVRIVKRFGRPQSESVAVFRERPLSERCQLIRTGRVIFFRQGVQLDIMAMLASA